MIHKPVTICLHAMSTGIAVIFVVLLLLPPRSVFAAGGARPMAHPMATRMVPAGTRAQRAAHPDPRVMQFNLELTAYKQTIATLERDAQRLIAQQRRLDALVNDMNQIQQLQLQEEASARNRAFQAISNVLKAVNESKKQAVHNIK